MEITIFAKKRTTREGKPFVTFISRLRKRDGSEQAVAVKFRDTCQFPKAENCPMNIIVEKENANMSSRLYAKEGGEAATSYTIWVSKWSQGSAYVDHSFDEFDV